MSAVAELDQGALHGLPLPDLAGEIDKDSRGRVLVVGGGAWGPGAPLLSALAALRSGAGKLQVAAAERFAAPLAVAVPEAAILVAPSTPDGELTAQAAAVLAERAQRADAVIVGPGIIDEEVGRDLACDLARTPGEARFVVDAGALTALDPTRPLPGIGGRLVMTPHAGEMARLLGCEKPAVQDDPLGAAREVARAFQAVVVMKGSDSYVVSPDGEALLHRNGVVGLATSGSGDVLAGVIGGLLAQGAPPFTAAAWGVWVHGAAGRRLSERIGRVGFLARELLEEIPGLIVRRGAG